MAACGSAGTQDKNITTDNLPQRPFFAGKVPISTGMGTYWVNWPTDNGTDNVVTETGSSNENSSQILLTGRVLHNAFTAGKFLLQLKGTKTCEGEVCADTEGVSQASQQLSKPGYYNLVVPRSEQAVYLVASYLPESGDPVTQEIYLGVIAGRMDHLDFNFSPPKEDPKPDPDPDPDPPFQGPTDLTAN